MAEAEEEEEAAKQARAIEVWKIKKLIKSLEQARGSVKPRVLLHTSPLQSCVVVVLQVGWALCGGGLVVWCPSVCGC